MPVGLLDLPTEVRDCIYRHLLLSSQCFNANNAGHKYEMYPAILRANRVTHHEATRVLYQENDFVRVILWGQAGARLSGWLKEIADIEFQPWVKACRPALTVSVGLGNMPVKCTTVAASFLIFPESLEMSVGGFHDYTIAGEDVDGVDPIGQLAISLELRSTVLSKRRMTQDDLLRPFRSLTGFADVKIVGHSDEELRDTMVHRMTHLPSPGQFSDSLEDFFQRGKEAYERRCWNEARHNWNFMQKYYEHIDTIVRSRFSLEESTGLLHQAVVDSRPLTHHAQLGILKAGLYLEDYSTVLRDLWVWEFEEEEMSALMKAKFFLGLAMAYHMEGFIGLGREAFKDVQDILAIEADRYTGQLVTIMDTIARAHDPLEEPSSHFLCAWEHCWELLNGEEVLDGEEDASSMEIGDAQKEVEDCD
ncbi:hypothetical protein MMC15_003141 [Xylographa vitiligo]|nr:hypothetical protein [Xylographa vitiligo]